MDGSYFFERLQALSRLIIIPAILLYLSGFICVTGFFAQFGFITFDIINARFLIAGFHALVPLLVCVWSTWLIVSPTLDKSPFSFDRTLLRYAVYLKALFYPAVITWCLSAFYGITNFAKTDDPATVPIRPMSSWDLVERFTASVSPSPPSILPPLILIFLYSFVLIVVAIAVVGSVVAIFQKYRRKTGVSGTVPAISTHDSMTVETYEQLGKALINGRLFRKSVVLLGDALFLATLVSVSALCYSKIRSGLPDAKTIGHEQVDFFTLYSWCFGTITSLLIVLYAFYFRPGGAAPKTLFSQLLTPTLLNQVMQQLVVPVLLSLFLFGAVVFPRIPFPMGGGQPRLVTVLFKDGFQRSGLNVYLIGETTQFFFAVQTSGKGLKGLQINKDVVAGILAKPPA